MEIEPMFATLLMEQEIIEEKLKQGINGFEWLVLQVVVDQERKESLETWERLQILAAKKKVNSLTLFSDAIRMDAEAFITYTNLIGGWHLKRLSHIFL